MIETIGAPRCPYKPKVLVIHRFPVAVRSADQPGTINALGSSRWPVGILADPAGSLMEVR